MNPISALFEYCKSTYSLWRLNGVSVLSCAVNLAGLILVYAIIPLESKKYSKLRHRFYYYYPQIKRNKPKTLDPLRVIIQTVYLIFVKQNHRDTTNMSILMDFLIRKTKEYIVQPVIRLTGIYTQKLHQHIRTSERVLPQNKRNLSLMFLILSFLASIVAISQPLDVRYQFVFVFMMWITALILKSVKNRVSLMLLIVISIIIATRYIYWRIHLCYRN